jgi:hypothetical protein
MEQLNQDNAPDQAVSTERQETTAPESSVSPAPAAVTESANPGPAVQSVTETAPQVEAAPEVTSVVDPTAANPDNTCLRCDSLPENPHDLLDAIEKHIQDFGADVGGVISDLVVRIRKALHNL